MRGWFELDESQKSRHAPGLQRALPRSGTLGSGRWPDVGPVRRSVAFGRWLSQTGAHLLAQSSTSFASTLSSVVTTA